MNRSEGRHSKEVPTRSKVGLALVLGLAILLVTGRNALLYGWSQGTVLATIATVPIALILYFITLRRWSR